MIAVRSLPLLLTLLLLLPAFAPGALAHEGHAHEDGPAETTQPEEPQYDRTTPLRRGHGPVPFFDYYEGAAFYGDVLPYHVGAQYIRDLDASGPWIVWQDAKREDIFAYNALAREGVYLTTGEKTHETPSVSGNRVVWTSRQYRDADLYAYDFRTGKTHVLADAAGEQRNPSLHGNWVAWEDSRDGSWQIWAHDFLNGTTFRVSDTEGRHSDPVLVGDIVLWRTYRYNVWDVAWYHLPTGEHGLATGDRLMEQPPFSNGHAAYILQETQGGWNLLQWDPITRDTTSKDLRLTSAQQPAAENDLLVQVHWNKDESTLAAYNFTTRVSIGITTHVEMMDSPILHQGVVYVPTWNGTDAALLAFRPNPVAFSPAPTVEIDTVGNYGVVLDDKIRVQGRILHKGHASNLTGLRYTLDDGATWHPLPARNEWSFILDADEMQPGRYRVRVVATFEDRPPVSAEEGLLIPVFRQGAHVGEIGERYHTYVLNAFYARYFGTNPASWAVLTLAAATLLLLAARWRLRTRPKRRPVIEYVRPDDDEEAPLPSYRGPAHRKDT